MSALHQKNKIAPDTFEKNWLYFAVAEFLLQRRERFGRDSFFQNNRRRIIDAVIDGGADKKSQHNRNNIYH
jgi:hypothetical protein